MFYTGTVHILFVALSPLKFVTNYVTIKGPQDVKGKMRRTCIKEESIYMEELSRLDVCADAAEE